MTSRTAVTILMKKGANSATDYMTKNLEPMETKIAKMSQETAFFLHAKMRLNPSERTGDVMVKVIVLMVLMNLLVMMNAKPMLGSAPTVLNASWQKRNVTELSTVQTILMKCNVQKNAKVKLGSCQGQACRSTS